MEPDRISLKEKRQEREETKALSHRRRRLLSFPSCSLFLKLGVEKRVFPLIKVYLDHIGLVLFVSDHIGDTWSIRTISLDTWPCIARIQFLGTSPNWPFQNMIQLVLYISWSGEFSYVTIYNVLFHTLFSFIQYSLMKY